MKNFEGLDCCETTLNTMFQSCNIDLRYVFFDKWNFNFDNTKTILGDALSCENLNRFAKYQICFHLGISEYVVDSGTDIASLFATIAQKKANNIIMAEIETYNYKYDTGYRKYYGTHYFSIVNCDNCGVWIIDSWYKKFNLFLGFADLISCLKKVIFINTSDYMQPNVSRDLIHTSLITSSDIDKIALFAERIPTLSLVTEFKNLPPQLSFLSPLDRSLRHIIMDRQRYKSFLQYSSEIMDMPTLSDISNEFSDNVSKWSTLRSIMLQSYFLNRPLDASACLKILEAIIEQEREIKSRLEDLI